MSQITCNWTSSMHNTFIKIYLWSHDLVLVDSFGWFQPLDFKLHDQVNSLLWSWLYFLCLKQCPEHKFSIKSLKRQENFRFCMPEQKVLPLDSSMSWNLLVEKVSLEKQLGMLQTQSLGSDTKLLFSKSGTAFFSLRWLCYCTIEEQILSL